VKQLADALENHKLRIGVLAQPNLPIFQAGNGKPLNLDNLVRRTIGPSLNRCSICRDPESGHKTEGHMFERDQSLPMWHGWHSFRRGLATNLHAMGVADKEIQGILRHDDVNTTMNIYIKNVSQSGADAMNALSEKVNLHLNLHQPGRAIELSERGKNAKSLQ
jgi:integrase